jgi:hypothetical protein
MSRQELKLKQASAVLQVRPKDLQNLIQFGVVKPKMSGGTYWFDVRTLLAAKVAFYLRDSLGTPTHLLSRLIDVLRVSEEKLRREMPNYVVFSFRLESEAEPLKLGIPIRTLEEQVESRMIRVKLFKDLPRGKKRRGWKKEFLDSLAEAAGDIGEISEEEILRNVRAYRKERRAPEITVAAEN